MAEENKCASGKQCVSTLFKVFLGIVFLVLALIVLFKLEWWRELAIVFKGCVGPALLLAALITFAIAKE